MHSSPEFAAVDAVALTQVQGGLLFDDRVVIVGCTPPFPPLKPGQIPWNPWIGQPYPRPL